MRHVLLGLLFIASPLLGDPPTLPEASDSAFREGLTKVMKALPDALKLGGQISSETIENVKRALQQASEKKTKPQTAADQVNETENLLLHIEALSKQLGTDVLKDVNRTVQELNAMSEEMN